MMEKRKFSIHKNKKTGKKRNISIIYITLLVISFAIFSFYYKISGIIFWQKSIDLFSQQISEIAFYFSSIDRDISKSLLEIDEISQAYISGDNILQTKEQDIKKLITYFVENKKRLEKFGFGNYSSIIQLLGNANEYIDDIMELLGKEEPYNYIVILQNTNEKRPNGWFFWSFAFISIYQARIQELEIIDAYFPDYIGPNTRIETPKRAYPISSKTIGFIAGNKFWFTDMDGTNLKTLFEKIFNEDYDETILNKLISEKTRDILLHKYIKGVIFVRLDMLEKIIPEMKEISRERQFTNAATDIIRGKDDVYKKEKYIKDVNDFFLKNKYTIFKNFINNFQNIVETKSLNIYLSNVSTGLQSFLETNNLNTKFNEETIYSRDTNNSFNKSDGFIQKNCEIIDDKSHLVREWSTDFIPIQDLKEGSYTLNIYYTLSIPDKYFSFIDSLKQKYNITLTEREESILALKPAIYDGFPYPKRRETKSTMYVPSNIIIESINWDLLDQKKFYPPFAQWIYYQILINKNHTTKTISIKFKK